ncbi:Type IV pilus biogenesis protein PilN [hydrothermal vent metagenome]|uniref:Type IV pilus biogenesis protein PilN n=1 Tax=hydrothermal vent metagenome TaxID=652676 RepID=A0A3B1A1I1_9ZZZZ
MARINLLPWRESQRKERQKDFIQLMVLAAILMAVIVGAILIQVKASVGSQESRNSYLESEIKVLQGMISQIKVLEDEKEGLVQRMDVIQELQRSRPGIVRMFDELVFSIPEGVYFSSLSRTGNVVMIEGRAQSNARVSSFMRNLDTSMWFDDPRLIVIDSAGQKAQGRNTGGHRFSLTVNQVDVTGSEGE